MSENYIPPNSDKFFAWQGPFMTGVTADSAHYGVGTPQFTSLTTKQATYIAAYTARKAAETALAMTKADEATARDDYEPDLRSASQVIQKNPNTTNTIRALLGLPIYATGPTPSPPITTVPVLAVVNMSALRQKITLRDSALKKGKSKLAKSLQLYRCVRLASDPAPTTMEEFTFVESVTALNYVANYLSSQANMIAYYIGFWLGKQKGDHSGVSAIEKMTILPL